MSTVPRQIPHYTIADYEQWEGKWELWGGHPIAMVLSPEFGHQNTVMNLAYAIRKSLESDGKCHCKVVSEVDWRIAEDTVVRPDLMAVCEPVATRWVEVTPTLVAEVLSPSTQDNDLNYKRDLYARQGVKHYLIVDAKQRAMETLLLERGIYTPFQRSDDGNTLQFELHDGCRISFDPADIWG